MIANPFGNKKEQHFSSSCSSFRLVVQLVFKNFIALSTRKKNENW